MKGQRKPGDRRDIELEKELDALYRSVAGMAGPKAPSGTAARETDRQRAVPGRGSRPAAAPVRGPSRRRIKDHRPFPRAILWGIFALALFLAILGLFQRAALNRQPLAAPGSGEPPPERHAIQLRAYPEGQMERAIDFLAEIRDGNPDARLETVSVPGQGLWHRILVGDFSSKAVAEEARRARGVDREYPYSFIQKSDPREAFPGGRTRQGD
jgi:hypothetical protein